MLRPPPTSATTWETISLPVRFENTMTGRVVEYATPEEIAPPHKVWGSREEKAVAEHEAAARRRLLDRLRRSKRWVPTDKPVTRKTLRQLEHERRERERRQIEAKLRAEYERQLEVELAKRSPVSEPAATSSEQPEPVEESVKQPRASTAQIRAWAKEQGLEVPARGSLPSDVVDAYHKAHAE